MYGDAALKYWELGFHGVLPLPPGQKKPVPTGYSGYNGIYPKYPDVFAWTEEFSDGNVALRVPDNVIGIDVDAYAGKTGGATYVHASRLWGVLPPTWMSTSRADGISGIRLYRVPSGTRLRTQITFPTEGLGHIEIIQRTHRYAVVAPSIHPDTGEPYQWADPGGFWTEDWPAVDDLPELPERWLQELAAPAEEALAEVDVQTVLASLPAGPMDASVQARAQKAVADLAPDAVGVGSRHDTTTAHVMALLRLAEQGHTGVVEALGQLAAAFVGSVGTDRHGEAAARTEFARMVTNPRAHQLIAENPTIDLAAISGVAQEHWKLAAPASPQRPAEAPEAPTVAPPPPAPPVHAQPAEDPFWDRRQSLRHIRQFAYARMCSPWSVLGVTLARTVVCIPPWITLPPLIGGRGSLNLFVALVGPSGGGKGASESAATDLLPAKVHLAPLGSGEGIAHQYAHWDNKEKEVVWDRSAVLFTESEIDTLAGISGRTGSTLMGKLRNAFSGEEIGFSYADATRRITLGKHCYRLCFVLGVQPTKAAPLISDAGGGTPQRFLWLPTTDPKISLDRPMEPPPLAEPIRWGNFRRDVCIPKTAETQILEAHIRRSRGEGDALDGHSLFAREKVCVALAALDGRTDCNEEDWELSGMIMAVSDATRALVTSEIRRADAELDIERGQALGRQRAEADAVADEAKVARVTRWVVRKLEELGGTASWTRIHIRMASRDRDYLETALMQLAEDGRIVVDSDRNIRLWETPAA